MASAAGRNEKDPHAPLQPYILGQGTLFFKSRICVHRSVERQSGSEMRAMDIRGMYIHA